MTHEVNLMDSYPNPLKPALPKSLPKDPVLRLRTLAAQARAQQAASYSTQSDAMSALRIVEEVAATLAEVVLALRNDGK